MKKSETDANNMAIFGLGFRPFFLLAGLSSCLLMYHRISTYHSGNTPSSYFDSTSWHSHEMLFGFSVAVIAGFLLTSVRNWINHPMPSGKSLAAIVLLWLAGRITPFFSSILEDWVIALIDWAFLPVLLAVVGIPIVRKKNVRNYGFLVVLGAMALANAEFHLRHFDITFTESPLGITLMLDLIVLIIVLMGGRVIPFFTRSALQNATISTRMPVEWAAVVLSIALMVGRIALLPIQVLGIIAGLAAVAHAVRLAGWHDSRVWKTPLLWVLHIGYAWIVVGYAMTALAFNGEVMPFLATHAFTAGTIGMITLGMMARVSLGHTGRILQPPKLTVLAFALVNLGAIFRAIAPYFLPHMYVMWIMISGGFWMLAFGLFLWNYFPILMAPRVDGKPG